MQPSSSAAAPSLRSVVRTMGSDDLATACRKLLVRVARAESGASRRELRAAARRFVRRHRRDAGYLRWVLRSAVRNAGLAVALLGLAAGVASAKATLFELRTGGANPFGALALGANGRSAPALGDLDGDGDLDLVSGNGLTSGFDYFANTGTVATPAYLERTGSADPLGGLATSGMPTPALGDLDADGDLDLVAGQALAGFAYFENTGTATSPLFIERTGAASPLFGLAFGSGGGSDATAALADLDADGDPDLVAGGQDGTFGFFENTGSATAPAFVPRTGAANPLAGVDVGTGSSLAMADLDRDGDLDLVAGNAGGTFVYLENTGRATRPAFVLRAGAASPVAVPSVGVATRPALGDVDGDGDLDLVAGEQDGVFDYLENLSGRLVARTGTANPLASAVPGPYATPTFADLDGDGDADLLVGESAGTFRYFVNTGSTSTPVYVERTGASNPLAGQDVGAASAPAFGDLDGDGDLDLVVGEQDGVFDYFANTGTPSSPAFALRTGAANPLNGQSVGSFSTPTLGDLDRDGDLDLVAGEQDGIFDYYENTGTAASPAFTARLGSENPLDAGNVGPRSTPALGDADGDGDLDLLAGTSAGTFFFFENSTLGALPAFAARTGAANPLDAVDVGNMSTPAWVDLDGDGDRDVVAGEGATVFNFLESTILDPAVAASELLLALNPLDGLAVGGSHSSPALADLDGDGDLDVLAGAYSGLFAYYENTGTATKATFLERFGGAHPLDAVDVGEQSAPAFGDLDGDGDLDLLAGRFAGTFAYYANTGSRTSPLFVARTGSANPLTGRDVGYLAYPVLVDLDGDGDLDLVAGEQDGVFDYYENTGARTLPAFTPRTGAANPLGALVVGAWSAPAFGDFDGDGDLDLVSGDQQGQFAWFENTGNARTPLFVKRTGAANPLGDQDVGSRSAPALGDLDGNGELDLVTGNHLATFQTFVLPEPARGLPLLLGTILLRRLGRPRRGSIR